MRLLFIAALLMLTSGCSTIDMTAYRDNRPRFDLFDYFEGKTRGWGIVQDRKGRLLRQFTVDIDGQVTGPDQLRLHEEFSWSDGKFETRTWFVNRRGEHGFTGTAADVVGEAEGVSAGNVFNWEYHLNLEVDGRTWKIAFDDWVFQVSDEILINRANMSKFGITVGEITIVFQKPKM
jgi:hypothetical protein